MTRVLKLATTPPHHGLIEQRLQLLFDYRFGTTQTLVKRPVTGYRLLIATYCESVQPLRPTSESQAVLDDYSAGQKQSRIFRKFRFANFVTSNSIAFFEQSFGWSVMSQTKTKATLCRRHLNLLNGKRMRLVSFIPLGMIPRGLYEYLYSPKKIW